MHARIGDPHGMTASLPTLRDIAPADHPRLLELNAASVEKLSPLDGPALEALLATSALARAAVLDGHVASFVIALREARAYGSDNYRWFDARYPRFLYVDRVVVDAACRGRGVARALYEDVFARARAEGVDMVACEYDLEPANPASARFHAAQGFNEVGTQVLGTGKRVSMQVAPVPHGRG
jgi:uncharacterized protein